jgi:hypothetical protein
VNNIHNARLGQNAVRIDPRLIARDADHSAGGAFNYLRLQAHLLYLAAHAVHHFPGGRTFHDNQHIL